MSNSSTTTEKWVPVHPGEILMEDFIKRYGINQNSLAMAIGVPPHQMEDLGDSFDSTQLLQRA